MNINILTKIGLNQMDLILLVMLFCFTLNTSAHSKNYYRKIDSKAGFPWSGKNWDEINKGRILQKFTDVSGFNTREAKNVILFLGDGMGFSTVASTRLYKAQKNKTDPEKNYLTFETLPYAGISRTYSVDRSTADSASTATAYLCGVKANLKTIGVREQVEHEKCEEFIEENKVLSAAKLAMKQGKWVGLVTTSKVTDASPAALYAHTPNRNWEAEVKLDSCKSRVKDIADQLVTDPDNQNIKVILGGGLNMFLPKGNRNDKRNIIEEWQALRDKGNVKHKYVQTSMQLKQVDAKNTDYLLGLFSDDVMAYDGENKDQPSLVNMSRKAVQILSKAPRGYFLFVEGGRIDHAHHENKALKAIKETLAFDEAVKGVTEMIDKQDTLVVVTADHSHVMTLGGYGSWDEPVLGFSYSEAKDKKKYLQIQYANGPGYLKHRTQLDDNDTVVHIPRKKITEDTEEADFQQDAGIWLSSETHAGEDVPIYAGGPWSHLFQSTEEQTYVAHVMMYATCVGQYADEKHCSRSATIATSFKVVVLAVVAAWYLMRH